LPPLDLPDSNSDHATKPDRISGKKRTNFPEPTTFPPELARECGKLVPSVTHYLDARVLILSIALAH